MRPLGDSGFSAGVAPQKPAGRWEQAGFPKQGTLLTQLYCFQRVRLGALAVFPETLICCRYLGLDALDAKNCNKQMKKVVGGVSLFVRYS